MNRLCRLSVVVAQVRRFRTGNGNASGEALSSFLHDLDNTQLENTQVAKTLPQLAKQVSPKETKSSADCHPRGCDNERIATIIDRAGKEAQVLEQEVSRDLSESAVERYAPSSPARDYLTSSELIQDKAPQSFVADAKFSLQSLHGVKGFGNVASISLVGTVTDPPSPVSASSSQEDSTGPCVTFSVSYSAPTPSEEILATLVIRCVGTALCSFATTHVSRGDLVHVLGHLAPIEVSNRSGSIAAVYVLPAGGNISIVLKSDR